MSTLFNDFEGNELLKDYFHKAIKQNHLAHSYIFEGPSGLGKKTFATELARILVCSDDETPCGVCNSCHMINSKNHPDVLYVEKKGKTSTKIDDVRSAISDMNIKPFQSAHKIIIINAADTLTVEAQNALLKPIEEPPVYGICILICEKISNLLPTIISRCVRIRFSPLSNEYIMQYLIEKGIDSMQADVYTTLSEGSLGKAKEMVENEEFLSLRKESINFISKIQECDIATLYDTAKEVSEYKEDVPKILNFWALWFRDISLIKSIGTPKDLFFSDYREMLMTQAQSISFKKVGIILENIKLAITDLGRNITTIFVLESLMLSINK